MTEFNGMAICAVYSISFIFDKILRLGNTFPPIIFNHVTVLTVTNTVPFKHECFAPNCLLFLFTQILEHFQQRRTIVDTNQIKLYWSSTKLCYRISLSCYSGDSFCHMDYWEQFLNKTKTRLPRLNKLTTSYEDLAIVTENYARVKQLELDQQLPQWKEFYAFFPLLWSCFGLQLSRCNKYWRDIQNNSIRIEEVRV